jgi:hypothetical protein
MRRYWLRWSLEIIWRHCFTGCCAGTAVGRCSYLDRKHACEPSDWCFASVASVSGIGKIWGLQFWWWSSVLSLDVEGENLRSSLYLVVPSNDDPYWRHCLESLNFLQGKTYIFDWVMTALVHYSLLGDVIFGELFL